jgi:hypothetical protein
MTVIFARCGSREDAMMAPVAAETMVATEGWSQTPVMPARACEWCVNLVPKRLISTAGCCEGREAYMT